MHDRAVLPLIILALVSLTWWGNGAAQEVAVSRAIIGRPVLTGTAGTVGVTLEGISLSKVTGVQLLGPDRRPLRGVTVAISGRLSDKLTVNVRAADAKALGAQENVFALTVGSQLVFVPVNFGRPGLIPTPAPDPGVAPDLIVKEITLAVRQPGNEGFAEIGAPVYTNSTVGISLIGKNVGNFAATFPDWPTMHWRLVQGPTTASAVGTFPCGLRIEPGQECGGGVNFITPGTVPAGSYTLEIKIDPDEKVREGNETNNTLSIPLVVLEAPGQQGEPDLVIESVVQEGNGVHATLWNQGTADAFFTGNGLMANGVTPFGEIKASGTTWIQAGQRRDVTIDLADPTCPPSGTASYAFTVDPRNAVAESTETNNTTNATLTYPDFSNAGSDLIVESVTFIPANPTTADRVVVSVEMKNQGAGAARFCKAQRIWMAFFPDRTGKGNSATGAEIEEPGETFSGGTTLVLPGDRAAGDYLITVTVDPDELAAETDDSNNTMSATLTIR